MGRRQEQYLFHVPWLWILLRHPGVPGYNDRIVGRDHRRDYDKGRYRLLGTIEGRVFVVIYTMRGSAMRIISARKANGREVREYERNTRQD